jgi:hypothetical protein
VATVGGRGYGDVTVNQDVLDALVNSPAGPVARMLVQVGQETTQVAKRNAPTGAKSSKTPGGHPSGYLRSQIGWAIGSVGGRLCVDVVSDAKTSPANPWPGENYALFNERPDLRPRGIPAEWRAKEGPYLVPAFYEALARIGSGTTITPRP